MEILSSKVKTRLSTTWSGTPVRQSTDTEGLEVSVLIGKEEDDHVSYTHSQCVNYNCESSDSRNNKTHLRKVLNYKEASIYLEEGADSEAPHLPWDRSVLTMLLLVHRKWLYTLEMVAAFLLLMLGLSEAPSIPYLELAVRVHTGLEIGFLIILLLVLLLKIRTRWISVWGQRRDLAKLCLILVMLVEAGVVMLRNKPHWRLTRCLRPVFLVENHYMKGVRRFLRQFIESLPPILDILILVLFMITVYSVLGFYLLGPTKSSPGSPYFQSLTDSMVNMFVLLTTANFPDIMMPSYAQNSWYCIYFISYLGINLYFLMNLMLTVVYKTFADIEEKKFKVLLSGKAEAANLAFALLKLKDGTLIDFSSYRGLMKEYRPLSNDVDTLLTWKYLNTSNCKTGLNKTEFNKVYQACSFQWTLNGDVSKQGLNCWYKGNCEVLTKSILIVVRLVSSKGFEYGVYGLVGLNAALLVLQAGLIKTTDQEHLVYNTPVGTVFTLMYVVEMALKLFGLGFQGYITCPWNLFDFIVTSTSFFSLGLLFSTYTLDDHMSAIVILRLVRVLRLFRIKKRFRDVFGTALILLPHLLSTVIVLLLLYYFFSIIGMELFSHLNLLNCCNGTNIESYFAHHPDLHTTIHGLYYLNNFHSLPQAVITLFELTVVNNWFIIMEAHVEVSGSGWARVYFIIFYLSVLVVMTIVVAAILEAFLFRIQYKKSLKKEEEDKQLSVVVTITGAELASLSSSIKSRMMIMCKYTLPELGEQGTRVLEFRGNKRRSREELQSLLNQSRSLEGKECAMCM